MDAMCLQGPEVANEQSEHVSFGALKWSLPPPSIESLEAVGLAVGVEVLGRLIGNSVGIELGLLEAGFDVGAPTGAEVGGVSPLHTQP